jgi:hypothetical protein
MRTCVYCRAHAYAITHHYYEVFIVICWLGNGNLIVWHCVWHATACQNWEDTIFIICYQLDVTRVRIAYKLDRIFVKKGWIGVVEQYAG